MSIVYTVVPCLGCGKPRKWIASQPSLRPRDLCPICAAKARRRPLADRFWEKVDKNGPIPEHMPHLGPCWIIGYATGPHGYPVIFVPEPLRTSITALCRCTHVVGFYLAHGRFPEPQANHRCDRKTCVKAVADDSGPAHVVEGTQQENVDDMVQKGRHVLSGIPLLNSLKTHCADGHPLIGNNVLLVNGRRKCRECNRRWDREAYVRKRGSGA